MNVKRLNQSQLLLLQHVKTETHINPNHLEAAIENADGDGFTLYFTSGLEIEVEGRCFVDLQHQLTGGKRFTLED